MSEVDGEAEIPSNLVDFINRYVPLTTNGKEAHGSCPYHDDTEKSLRVGETWRCIGCCEQERTSNDACGFLQSFLQISAEEAQAKLANGELPEPQPIAPAKLARPALHGGKFALNRPKDIIWIHDYGPAVFAARELIPERVHLGLIDGRSWTDLGIPEGRHCVLVPGNTDAKQGRMLALAERLHGAKHKVRLLDTSAQAPGWTIETAKLDGWTHDEIMQWGKSHMRPYPFNDAAQQDNQAEGASSGAVPVARSSASLPNTSGPAAAASPYAAPEPELPASSPAASLPRLSTGSLSAAEAQQPAPGAAPHNKVEQETQPRPPTQAAEANPELLRSPKGELRACDHNAKALLAAAQQYDDLHFDEFLCRLRIDERDWSDHDDRDTLCWLQAAHGVPGFTLGMTRTAVMALGFARRCDSLSEFVMGVPEWDGTERIEHAFIDAWGAVDTALTRAASRNFFVALHARAVKPGAQVDNLWVIEGPQGILKSASLRALGGAFHAEISAQVGTADFLRELRGIWIAEMSELDSLRGREASTVKRLLSAPSDRFVDKYDRHAAAYARRAVVVATTNEATYWQDSTGARRLIPICATKINLDLIHENRLQWFAEARTAHQAGATWWEFPEGILAEQESRQVVDPWEDLILAAMQGPTWSVPWISTSEITKDHLKLDAAQQGPSVGARLSRIMRRLGYLPLRSGHSRVRGWKKIDRGED